MPAKNLLRVSEKGTYLHIYNKGIENRNIFVDEQDYSVFLSYLGEYLTSPTEQSDKRKSFTVKGKTYQGTPHQPKNYFKRIELVSYALLPDHFHLILHQSEVGALENFLRSLCTRYSIYFNKKYDRRGALFEGPYKSAHVQDTTLLIRLVTYIQMAHGVGSHTSHNEYLGNRSFNWVDVSHIQKSFTNADKKSLMGAQNYIEYAEKYILDTQEKSVLADVVIEKQLGSLERRLLDKDLASKPTITEKKVIIEESPRKTRFPEYIALSLVFLFLVGLGVRNINTIEIQSGQQLVNLDISTVDSAKDEVVTTQNTVYEQGDKEEFLAKAKNIDVLSATDSSSLDAEYLIYSLITIKEGSGDVSIYKSQEIDAEVVMTAHEGDSFIATPIDGDWYMIRFTDNTFGYILANHISLELAPQP